MGKFDHESLLATLLSVMQSGSALNNKIAAIEAEKVASGFPVTNITGVDSTNGYFEQNWSDAILNITPAIFYGIEKIDAEGIGPATMETIQCFVEIVLTDPGQDNLANKRVARYSRAIKEVFEEYFQQAASPARVKIKTIRPLSFKLDSNSSEEIRVGGISLTMVLA